MNHITRGECSYSGASQVLSWPWRGAAEPRGGATPRHLNPKAETLLCQQRPI